jgi:oligopeptide/dipeptide ABC transporter ATP-binding protein
LANPQHPYTQGLLGAIPKSTTPRGKLAAIAGSVPQLIDPPAQCHFQSRCQWSASACTKNVPQLADLNSKRQVACLRFGGENYKNVPMNELPSQLNFTELNKS